MSKPFDATTKDLLEAAPGDWVTFLDRPRPARAVSLIDAELSTVTTAADKVIRVEDERPWLLHLEFQSGRDVSLPLRLLKYHALLWERHDVPVATVLVLLREAADGPELTGRLLQRPPIGPAWEFGYQVIRVWREPPDRFLTGGLGVLPLAPISDVEPADLGGVILRMKQRLDQEASRSLAAKLWAASYVLLGLHYPEPFIDGLLQGAIAMEESTTYQAIIRKGRMQEAREMLLRLGRKHLGPPAAAVEAAVNSITDLAQLEQLSERLFDVRSWEELIPTV